MSFNNHYPIRGHLCTKPLTGSYIQKERGVLPLFEMSKSRPSEYDIKFKPCSR